MRKIRPQPVKIDWQITDRLSEQWSPAMNSMAKYFIGKFNKAKSNNQRRKINASFNKWCDNNSHLQF